MEEVETKKEAIKRERYYILKHNSHLPDFGYNSHINESTSQKLKKYVKCVETGELFKTQTEAAVKVKAGVSSLNAAIHRKIRCQGYHWEIVLLTEDEYLKNRS